MGNLETISLIILVFWLIIVIIAGIVKNKDNMLVNGIGVVLTIALIIVTIMLLMKYIPIFFLYLTKMASKLDAVVIVALITGTLTVISSALSKFLEYRQDNIRYLVSKREKSYLRFIEMIYKKLSSGLDNSQYDHKDFVKDFYAICGELTLWGSKSVVNKIFLLCGKINDDESISKIIDDIMNEMRKDLGVGKTANGKILDLIIKDKSDQKTQ